MRQSTVTTIVAVDDDPSILVALRRSLERPGFRVITTTEPVEVPLLLRREQGDILISDVNMPRMTGLELLGIVRNALPTVVRILLTGDSQAETAVHAINDGEVFRYLSKPWERSRLLRTIDEAVDKARSLRQTDALANAKRTTERLMEELELEHPGIGNLPQQGTPYQLEPGRLLESARKLPMGLLRTVIEGHQGKSPP